MTLSIVIGGGAAGISAAHALLASGHDVIIVEKHKSRSRSQRVLLKENLINDLYLLSGLAEKNIALKINKNGKITIDDVDSSTLSAAQQHDYAFLKKLAITNGVVTIQDYENYALQKLINLSNDKSVTYQIKTKEYTEGLFSLLSDENKQNRILGHTLPFFVPTALSTTGQQNEFEDFLEHVFAQLPKYMSKDTLSHDITETINLNYSGTLRFINSTVIDIEPNNQTIKLKSNSGEEQELKFDYLIDAAGASSPCANMIVNSDHNYAYLKEVEPLPKIDRKGSDYNMTGEFSLKIANPTLRAVIMHETVFVPEKDDLKPVSNLDVKYQNFVKLGWENENFPVAYMQIEEKGEELIFYITGEIPEVYKQLSQTQLEQQIQKWAQAILFQEFDKYIESMSDLQMNKFSCFEVNRTHKKECVANLGKDGKLFVIGDSFLPAYYLFGHGMNDAVYDGLALFYVFDEQGNVTEDGIIDFKERMKQRVLEFDDYCRAYVEYLDPKYMSYIPKDTSAASSSPSAPKRNP